MSTITGTLSWFVVFRKCKFPDELAGWQITKYGMCSLERRYKLYTRSRITRTRLYRILSYITGTLSWFVVFRNCKFPDELAGWQITKYGMCSLERRYKLYTRSRITRTRLYRILSYFEGHLPHQKSLH